MVDQLSYVIDFHVALKHQLSLEHPKFRIPHSATRALASPFGLVSFVYDPFFPPVLFVSFMVFSPPVHNLHLYCLPQRRMHMLVESWDLASLSGCFE